MLTRRDALATGLAAAASLAAPAVIGQARPRVVVVGGGSGGATAARYVAIDSAGAIAVTLIEPARAYYTCYFGNLFIGGFRPFDSLAHSYAGLAVRHGIHVVHDWATGIDRDARTVALAGGGTIPYDRLVLSPGIDFVPGAIEGWDLAAQARMPHAYRGGTQVALLKAQVEAMPAGGTFAMITPPNPYRCPPGPYERLSMIAHLLKARNPTAKILVFEPKEGFSKQTLFEEAWATHYPGVIDFLPDAFTGGIDRVDPGGMEVVAGGETFRVDAANVIPAQRAGLVAEAAGLTDAEGWVPIDPFTMKARVDPNVFVLGDAARQGDMPKSGFSANSQAKVAAMVIRGELIGAATHQPHYANICWSLLGAENGVKIGAAYAPTEEKIATVEGSTFVSQPGEDAATRRETYLESLDWYAAITADMFG